MPRATRARQVLLVEDDVMDAELIQYALSDCAVQCDVRVATSVQEALRELEEQVPELVLLDVHFPGDDGLRVLEAIRSTPELHLLPVVVFSDHTTVLNTHRGYSGHANAVVPKGQSAEAFRSGVVRTAEFFLNVARLAPAPR